MKELKPQKFETGDWAFSLRRGWDKIVLHNTIACIYPVAHRGQSYLPDGRSYPDNNFQDLFTVENAALLFDEHPPKGKREAKFYVWKTKTDNGSWKMTDVFYDDHGRNTNGIQHPNWDEIKKIKVEDNCLTLEVDW